MKDKISLLFLNLLARGPVGKFARHALSWVAGWIVTLGGMESHGAVDPHSLFSLLVAALMLAIVSAWSAWTKKPLAAEQRFVVRGFIEALLGHLLPVFAGYMARQGYQGGADDAGAMLEWGGVAAINYARSFLQRPDAKRGDKETGNLESGRPLYFDGWLWFAIGLPMILGSCASAVKLPAGASDWKFRACIELPVGEWIAGMREDSRREITESTGLDVVK